MSPEPSPAETVLAPLAWRVSAGWVKRVESDVRALLCDHAHLERKAAVNALALIPMWPQMLDSNPRRGEVDGSSQWVTALSAIARDESQHLATVVRELHQRGGALIRCHTNPYARGLHELVRRGKGMHELMDRLMVSALIELRSYERFVILAHAMNDPGLRHMYERLRQSEHGHYLQFLELAAFLPISPLEQDARWIELCEAESRIALQQTTGPWMHSGDPDGGYSVPRHFAGPGHA